MLLDTTFGPQALGFTPLSTEKTPKEGVWRKTCNKNSEFFALEKSPWLKPEENGFPQETGRLCPKPFCWQRAAQASFALKTAKHGLSLARTEGPSPKLIEFPVHRPTEGGGGGGSRTGSGLETTAVSNYFWSCASRLALPLQGAAAFEGARNILRLVPLFPLYLRKNAVACSFCTEATNLGCVCVREREIQVAGGGQRQEVDLTAAASFQQFPSLPSSFCPPAVLLLSSEFEK